MIVAVLILDFHGRVLLQLRDESKNIVNPGKIGLFGGTAFEWETPKLAALRELAEELHLNLSDSNLQQLAVTVKEAPDGNQESVYVFLAQIGDVDSMCLCEGCALVLANPTNILESSHLAPLTRKILTQFFEGVIFPQN